MKRKILRIILFILIIVWMCMVFNFSSSNGDSSSSLSQGFIRFFIDNEDIIILIEPVIRKIAHLTEYALGGFLILGFFLTFDIKLRNQIIFSGLWGIIYASTDEFHQLFIPGRAGKWQDVIIDTIGFFIGILVLLLIRKIVKKINLKNKGS